MKYQTLITHKKSSGCSISKLFASKWKRIIVLKMRKKIIRNNDSAYSTINHNLSTSIISWKEIPTPKRRKFDNNDERLKNLCSGVTNKKISMKEFLINYIIVHIVFENEMNIRFNYLYFYYTTNHILYIIYLYIYIKNRPFLFSNFVTTLYIFPIFFFTELFKIPS